MQTKTNVRLVKGDKAIGRDVLITNIYAGTKLQYTRGYVKLNIQHSSLLEVNFLKMFLTADFTI